MASEPKKLAALGKVPVNFEGATLKMDATAIYYASVFGPISKLAR